MPCRSAHRRRPGRATLATLLTFLGTVAMIGGCSGDPETAPPAGAEPAPIGAELYEKRLTEASGSAIPSLRLVELATQAEAVIEERMDAVARTIRPGDDWRPVFEEVRADHPSTVEDVLAAYRGEVTAAADFLGERDWVTLPPTRPGVAEAQSGIVRRNFPLALYVNGVLGIVTAPDEGADPAYLANHCRVCIPPLAVHEAYPGHHVAFYHAAIDRHGLELGETVEIRGQPENFYFHEGWGLYSEILMLAAGYYQEPARELAAWRMVLLRATRARLDALLHRGEIARDQAIAVYRESLLMEPRAAATEVRRHLRRPTNKATYFVGLLQIQALARQILGAEPAMDPRSFHDRLLRQPRRLPVIARDEFSLELAALEPLELTPTLSW